MIFQFETGYSIQFQDGEKLPKKKRDAADYRKDCFLKGGLSWIPKPISEKIIVDALQKKYYNINGKNLNQISMSLLIGLNNFFGNPLHQILTKAEPPGLQEVRARNIVQIQHLAQTNKIYTLPGEEKLASAMPLPHHL